MPLRHSPSVSALVSACGGTVVRTTSLEGLGLHRATIARRCRPGGPWRSMCTGIVLLTNNVPTRDERRRAGLLHAGAGAVITGLDALALHGTERIPAPHGPVPVLVPADRRIVGHGLVVAERTHRLPDPAPGRWPVAPLERAVLDHARRLRDRDRVRSATAEVVQRGRCTPSVLWAELLAGNSRGRALPREVLVEISDGVRSVAEAKARLLVRGSGPPQPLWNPRLIDDETGQLIAVVDGSPNPPRATPPRRADERDSRRLGSDESPARHK